MNDSAYRISLDIHEHGSQAVLKAKLTDTGRKIYISLRSGGTPYTIAEDCYAVFTATKPDGSILFNACTIEGNEIVYEFTEQTCAAVGRSRCEIKLYGLNDVLITSPRFALLVDGTVYPDGMVESSNEFSALTQMVSDGLEAIRSTNLATEAATQATNSANEAAGSANNATDAAIQATNNAIIAANAANQASGAADQSASAATNAAAAATKAATDATTAANSAITATGEANTAVSNANLAAEKANKAANTAKALMVVGSAGGNNISMDNAIDQFLAGLRICGKTTQNGTPTPENPVELVSVGGSGIITVNIAGNNDVQNMIVATPDGLPGIPVTSGGNYTDANGQQWVCDEVNLARGVHVRRVGVITLDGTQMYAVNQYQLNLLNCYLFEYYNANLSSYTADIPAISDKLIYGKWEAFAANETRATLYATSGRVIVFLPDQTIKTVEAFKAYLSGNPIRVLYQLNTPIETPLPAEEITAYSALHTYREHTTVTNDAGAWMDLEYVMDAKKYIDYLVAAPIPRLSSITLSASAWTGADSLYSQVVTIDGVTEYSKVDLLPSVEQLAIFHNKDVAFVTENEDGVVTVFAIGEKPTNDYTMQVQITEVSV